MQSLEKLFGSKQRIRLMRFFLMHPLEVFDIEELTTRTKSKKDSIKRDLAWLLECTVIRTQYKKITTSRGTKKTVTLYGLNQKCTYKDSLYSMLLATGEKELDELEYRFKKAGKIDLLIASGFFVQNPDARLDLLIAGKQLKKSKIESVVQSLEAEIGRELLYAFFETEDFLYRAHMYDKLIRDVIDFNHIKVLDKGVIQKIPTMA